MSKIIIFGGSGFVGSAVRALLEKKEAYYLAPKRQEIDLEYYSSEINIKEMVEDGDTVIMISAQTAEHGEAYRLTDINIRMAANVLSGMAGKNLAHFVYVSSDSVYGVVNGEVTEETPLCPDSLYGYMHAVRERMFQERFAPDNLTILRPCAVYGVGDTHNSYGINEFVRTSKVSHEVTLFGEGEEYRSNVHVDDMAAIIVKAAMQKIPGIFNVNCGKSYTFREIAEIVKVNMGGNVDIFSKPRTQPITHRLVGQLTLLSHFPTPRLADIGIKEMVHAQDIVLA